MTRKRPQASSSLSATPKKQKTMVIDTRPTVTPQKTNDEEEMQDSNVNLSTLRLASHVSELSVPFVNREGSSMDLLKCLVLQKVEKGIIPILSQHFGSGKTSLVRNFRKVLSSMKDIKLSEQEEKQFSTIQKAVLVEHDCSEFNEEQTVPHNLKDRTYKKLVTRMISEFNQRNDEDRRFIFSKNVLLHFASNLGLPISDELTNEKDCSETARTIHSNSSDFMSFLDCWSLRGLWPLLFFFDEVSYLEYLYKSTEGVTQLWKTIKPAVGSYETSVKYPGVYFVFAGKSSFLSKSGWTNRGLASPISTKHIILEPLSIEHTNISTRGNVLTMEKFLKDICHSDYEYFLQVLYEYTGGIPRLVVTAIASLSNHFEQNRTITLSKRNQIDEVFENFKKNDELKLVAQLSEIEPFRNVPSDHLSLAVLKCLYVLGKFGYPFDAHGKLFDLIFELNVGIEEKKVKKGDSEEIF